MRFTPESVEPSGITIIKLWTLSGYEYNEDGLDILQRTITTEPEYGSIVRIGNGEYLFTAPDTLTADSIVVTINYENYNQACAFLDDTDIELQNVEQADDCIECFPYGVPALFRHYRSEQLTIKWDSLYVEVNPSELFPGDTADVVIKKRLPDGTLTEFDTTQRFEAAMLDGCILGNILVGDSLDTYFYDVGQPIKFVADAAADSSGLVLLRIGLVEETLLKKKNNKTDTDLFDCIPGPVQTTKYRIVQAEIKDIELIILEPTETTVDTFITAEPSMPNLTVRAKLEGYTGGDFNFEWKYVLSWSNNSETPSRTIQSTFEGSEPGLLSGVTSWEINWDDALIGGDNDTLFVTVYTVPKIYRDTVINPYRILGTNPTPQEVKEGLTIHEQIVVYLESFPKWHQFNNGFPIFGPPHGYGLMQLDNPRATDEQVWNWRDNRTEGQQRLAEKYNDAIGYPNRVRRTYAGATDFTTDEQIWKETYQRYRGGSYWRWKPNDRFNPSGEGEWLASPSEPHTRGEEAWEIYEGIQLGNYPPNWN